MTVTACLLKNESVSLYILHMVKSFSDGAGAKASLNRALVVCIRPEAR